MKDIRYLLTAWGNWSGSRTGTEYRGAWPQMQQESDIRPMLIDEEAETVDRAVGRLKHFDPQGYAVVVAHYRERLSPRSIAGKIKRHHSYAYARLEKAEAYIAGRLHELSGVV